MSDETQRSGLSDEATFKVMKEQEGQGRGGNDSIYALEQREAKDGSIANVDRLDGIGENQSRKKKEQAEAIVNAAAVKIEIELQATQAQLESATIKLRERIDSPTFLSDATWKGDFKAVVEVAKPFNEKFKLSPETVTNKEHLTVTEAGAKLHAAVDRNPEKVAEVVSDPDSRMILNRAIFVRQRLMADGELDLNLSRDEQINQIVEYLETHPEAGKAIQHDCTSDAHQCERFFKSGEIEKFTEANIQLDKIIQDKYADQVMSLKGKPDAEVQAGLMDIRKNALQDLGEINLEGRDLILEKMVKFEKSPQMQELANSIYADVKNEGLFQKIGKAVVETTSKAMNGLAFVGASFVDGIRNIAEKAVNKTVETAQEATSAKAPELQKSPEQKSISELPKEAMKEVEKVKEACSCSHDKPKAEEKEPETIKIDINPSGIKLDGKIPENENITAIQPNQLASTNSASQHIG